MIKQTEKEKQKINFKKLDYAIEQLKFTKKAD